MDVPTGTDGAADPRMNEAYLGECDGGPDEGDVVVVGVAHDHPASQYRVRRVVEAVAPETLALELPPLALPLFERYADDEAAPPTRGGEMSAAIQATDDARVVGVDGPTAGFARRLLRTLAAERAAPPTVLSSLRGLASVAKHAAACRLAATASRLSGREFAVDSATAAYDVGPGDAPEAQAENERRQVRRAQFVLQAFGSSRAGTLRDATRDEHMAARLSTLRAEGDVVAVVGIDHLDPLVDLLDDRT